MTQLSKNIVALSKGLVVIPRGSGLKMQLREDVYAASLQASLMQLGYMLSREAYALALSAPAEWVKEFYDEAIPYLKEAVGAKRDYRAMYRNFPQQVMDLSHVDLFINAITHYWSNGQWEPPHELAERGVKFESTEFKLLKPIDEAGFLNLFTQMVAIGQALTPQDRKIVEWFIDSGLKLTLPETIPFKETLCLLAAKGLNVPVKTPTDVLRIAVHLSGGDISLPGIPSAKVKAPTGGRYSSARYWETYYRESAERAAAAAREAFKFRKFKRPQRRLLLEMLDRVADVAEMQRYLGRWLRLGEILHPGEFAGKFPRAHAAFKTLRNQEGPDTRVRTFDAQVNLAFAASARAGLKVLTTRPGEFARRLDWLLRTHDAEAVMDVFTEIAPRISSKVLFELWTHLVNRETPGAARTVMLKGRGAKFKTLPTLPALPTDVVQLATRTIAKALKGKIKDAKLPSLGNVWIDPQLATLPLPASMRDMNTGLKTYVRGTRLPFRGDAKVVRAFVHWYDEDGTQDIDLSFSFHGHSLEAMGHVSFTNLREGAWAVHSGDIRHRVGSCAEYIDVNIEKARQRGVRYVMVHCYNFNGRPMHTVPECRFGMMEREHQRSNEIFEARTVTNAMPLINQGTTVLACILDLQERCMIWADMEADRYLAVVENTASKAAEAIRKLVGRPAISVADLLRMHAEVRGEVVQDEARADTKFKAEDLTTDYVTIAGLMSLDAPAKKAPASKRVKIAA